MDIRNNMNRIILLTLQVNQDILPKSIVLLVCPF